MNNPLLQKWSTPFEMPPFDLIQAEHFSEAFELALRIQKTEIEAIAQNPDAPTFQNTLIALESSGELLNQTSSVFFNLSSSHTSKYKKLKGTWRPNWQHIQRHSF